MAAPRDGIEQAIEELRACTRVTVRVGRDVDEPPERLDELLLDWFMWLWPDGGQG
jgi:hypothetical protein